MAGFANGNRTRHHLPMTCVHAERYWTPQGWRPATFAVAEDGSCRSEPAGGGGERLGRWVLPGMPNIHSHAFQRAMSGLAERRGSRDDSFWTWRERMYAIAGQVDPESLQAIAAQLYAEMLEAGYTTVCEFHYLHHAPDGRPYTDTAAMARALVEAARETGIRLRLLPTLYRRGGFDGRPLAERQRRFGMTVDAYLELLETLHGEPEVALGVAFHSLRAVAVEDLRVVLDALPDPAMPVHIHVAEQQAEVEDCLAHHGTRPVQRLLAELPVDARWTLVHATHVTPDELAAIAACGAVVALCPSTEANLGDGLFPLRALLDAGGRFGIGSDSHVSVSLVEELRWLEYGQRLRAQRRNLAADGDLGSCGEALFAAALAGGRQAAGLDDARADFVVLDDAAIELAARADGDVLDGWLFGSSRPLVRGVMVDGRWRVREGRHLDRDRIEARYRKALRRVLGDAGNR